ncbi:MAG: hypothetical protein K5920_11980 [Bacteroidales bacterium]|nr:hypothetical protein [Bacteroidales bacterium]
MRGIFRDLFGLGPTKDKKNNSTKHGAQNVYSNLTYNQKLAAMNLMLAFGGSCSGTPEELNKINHIMTQEGRLLGISADEMNTATSSFNGMKGMSDALKGADRLALEKLFWAFYCIIAAGKNEMAVRVLLSIYEGFGFSTQDCLSILNRKTGINLEEL